MNSISALQINEKINALPSNLLKEVDDYIDFLNYKNLDWAVQLSENQIEFVNKGINDISENRLYSHNEAKEKIKNYIKKKTI